MILYELKKLITGKLFIVSTLIVAVLYAYILIPDTEYDAQSAAEFSVYISTQVPQPITQEWIDETRADYELKSEEYFAHMGLDDGYQPPKYFWTQGEVLSQLDYAQQFREDMIKTVTNAVQLKANADAASNGYESAYNSTAASTYNSVVQISLINNNDTESFFNRMHSTSGLQGVMYGPVFIMWAILLTVYLLCCERGSKTDYIAHTSAGGRGSMFLHKLAAVTIVVFAMTLLTLITEIIYGAAVYRLNFFASIQSVHMFEYCIYKLNILGMIILLRLMMFCAGMLGVFCAALFSIKAATPIRGMVLGFILAFGSYRLLVILRSLRTAEGIAQSDFVRMLFPPYMIYPENYFRSFDYGNLFGIPMPRLAVAVGITVLLGIISTIVCAKLYGRSADIRWKAKLLSLIKSPKHTEA
ncbi:MAG: hypothetical protein J1E39_05480 [Eubacterium sp.]|nr:hypothetical protein [Eubacterium sp.]